MLCSAVNFYPRGISRPTLVYTTRESLSKANHFFGGVNRCIWRFCAVLRPLREEVVAQLMVPAQSSMADAPVGTRILSHQPSQDFAGVCLQRFVFPRQGVFVTVQNGTSTV
jgi:hypothetical protein